MNFSFEQLLAFVTAYNERSFSKAAVKLSKHRTTIGQVITNLEDQLSVELFERAGKSLIPTEDGEILYYYAKQAIEQTRTFDKVALSLSYGEMESINFAYPSYIPHQILSDLRLQLLERHPQMRVNFLVRNQTEIKAGIKSGTIDFALVNIHHSRALHSLDTTLLDHIEFLPFVKKGGKFSGLSAQEAYSVLCHERQFILRSFVEDSMSDKIIVSSNFEEIDQISLVIKLIGLDVGWALLPRTVALLEDSSAQIESLKLKQMNEGFRFSIALWCPHSKQNRAVKESILMSINESISELRASV